MNENSISVGRKRKTRGIPTYQGQLLQELLLEQLVEKEDLQKEKQEAQQIIKISLSALIKRALKAKNEAMKTQKPSKPISHFPIPSEYMEALKLHCAHNAKMYSEESIYLEFYNVLEKELSLEHFPLQCLYLMDSFLHLSNVFRSIVASNVNKLISALERTGILRSSNSNGYFKECRDYLLEIVDLWALAYGSTHKSFVMVKRFLRETLHLNAPNIEERIIQIENEKMAHNEEQWTLLVDGSERIIYRSWPDAKQEIALLFQRLEESFQALLSCTTEDKSVDEKSMNLKNQPNSTNNSSSIVHDVNSEQNPSPNEQIYTNNPSKEPNVNANVEWEHIQWESDEVLSNEFVDDDSSLDDIFGENLLYASATFSGDLTIIVDPHKVQTFRGEASALDREAKERYQKEIRNAVATATKHLLSLYKLIDKWKKLLQRFLNELHRFRHKNEEYIRFWQQHKKRRRLLPEMAVMVNTTPSSTAIEETSISEIAAERDTDTIDQSLVTNILGKDCALLERLEKASLLMVQDEIPVTMHSIRSLVDNQIRALLYARTST